MGITDRLKAEFSKVEEDVRRLKIDEQFRVGYKEIQKYLPEVYKKIEGIKEELEELNKKEEKGEEDIRRLKNIGNVLEEIVNAGVKEIRKPEEKENRGEKKDLKEQFYARKPEIEKFYNQKNISVTETDELYINVLSNLTSNKKTTRARDLLYVLNKIDPKRYNKKVKNPTNKIFVHLREMEKKGIVYRDGNSNYIIKDYNEISNLVEDSLKEIEFRIRKGRKERKYEIEIEQRYIDAIKNGEFTPDNFISLTRFNNVPKQQIRALFEKYNNPKYNTISKSAGKRWGGLLKKAEQTGAAEHPNINGVTRYVDIRGGVHQKSEEAMKATQSYIEESKRYQIS